MLVFLLLLHLCKEVVTHPSKRFKPNACLTLKITGWYYPLKVSIPNIDFLGAGLMIWMIGWQDGTWYHDGIDRIYLYILLIFGIIMVIVNILFVLLQLDIYVDIITMVWCCYGYYWYSIYNSIDGDGDMVK